MFPLCFFYFIFDFVIFYLLFFLQNRTMDQDQNWQKNDPYLEGIEAKFQRDLFTVFGEGAFCHICNRRLDIQAAVDKYSPYVVPAPNC